MLSFSGVTSGELLTVLCSLVAITGIDFSDAKVIFLQVGTNRSLRALPTEQFIENVLGAIEFFQVFMGFPIRFVLSAVPPWPKV